MRERRVTEILAQKLKEEGFVNLAARSGKEHGPDLEAKLPASGRKLYKVHPPLARLGIHALFVGEDGQIWHLGRDDSPF